MLNAKFQLKKELIFFYKSKKAEIEIQMQRIKHFKSSKML